MSEVWTIGRIVGWATDYLARQGSETPRLDTQLLLGHVCGLDKVQLYVQFDRPLQPQELADFKALLQRRANHEPVAYILGTKAFYGRDFFVSKHVLVPRPETEHLVDAVLDHVRTHELEAPKIVDVGTGSGCIAITLALELEDAIVLGVDASKDALNQASENAVQLGIRERVKLTQGDVLSPVKNETSVDVVVSNPPYLDAELMGTLAPDIRDHEPHLALSGGDDGLDVLRRLIDDATRVLVPGGLLAMEIAGTKQAQHVDELCQKAQLFTDIVVIQDYQQIPRVVTTRRRG